MVPRVYRCSQQELYTICHLGWQNCHQHLAAFVAFKPKYTAAFIAARQAEVSAAQLLPDLQHGGEVPETLHIHLTEQTLLCLQTWQKLKRYIADAYPPNLHKSKTEAAGQFYYRGASAYNLDKVQGLLTSGLTFITNNVADLTANLNMPPAFLAEFATVRTNFNTLHQNFLDKEEATRLQTEQKQQANNSIYTALISMFLDGHEIYKNQEAHQHLFILDQVLLLISGAGVHHHQPI